MTRNEKLKSALNSEMAKGIESYKKNNLPEAFSYFERAHILGQPFPLRHTKSHVWMLLIAIRKLALKEFAGQLFRIPSGFIGSAIGIYPKGNTGGSNVNPFKPMPIPEDLKKFFSLGHQS